MLVLSSQRFPIRRHAHIRLTVRVIHDLTETGNERRELHRALEFALKAHSTLYSCEGSLAVGKKTKDN